MFLCNYSIVNVVALSFLFFGGEQEFHCTKNKSFLCLNRGGFAPIEELVNYKLLITTTELFVSPNELFENEGVGSWNVVFGPGLKS
mgnify:CR=1 FL=1